MQGTRFQFLSACVVVWGMPAATRRMAGHRHGQAPKSHYTLNGHHALNSQHAVHGHHAPFLHHVPHGHRAPYVGGYAHAPYVHHASHGRAGAHGRLRGWTRQPWMFARQGSGKTVQPVTSNVLTSASGGFDRDAGKVPNEFEGANILQQNTDCNAQNPCNIEGKTMIGSKIQDSTDQDKRQLAETLAPMKRDCFPFCGNSPYVHHATHGRAGAHGRPLVWSRQHWMSAKQGSGKTVQPVTSKVTPSAFQGFDRDPMQSGFESNAGQVPDEFAGANILQRNTDCNAQNPCNIEGNTIIR